MGRETPPAAGGTGKWPPPYDGPGAAGTAADPPLARARAGGQTHARWWVSPVTRCCRWRPSGVCWLLSIPLRGERRKWACQRVVYRGMSLWEAIMEGIGVFTVDFPEIDAIRALRGDDHRAVRRTPA